MKTIHKIWKFIFFNPLFFWLYFSVILVLVLIPVNSSGQLNNFNIISFRGDYFLHAMLFIPWAFFCRVFRLHLVWWFIAGLFFAFFSEGLQYPLPYRAWNINDVIANASGVFIGFILHFSVPFFFSDKKTFTKPIGSV